MSMRRRAMMSDTEWNEVWNDYDARRPSPPVAQSVPSTTELPARPSFTPSAARASSRPGVATRCGRALAWAMLPMVALGWVSAPYATAWHLAAALDGRDHDGLSRHMNPVALQGAVRAALNTGPAAPDGEQASAFLAAMADDIAAAWATPAALSDVARARGVRPGASAEGLRRAMPVSLTRFEMPLHGAASPMTLQLELKQEGLAPRWQVTGVRLDQVAPAAGPGPALRLSAIR